MKSLTFIITGWFWFFCPLSAQTPLLYKVIDPNPDNYYQSDKGTNVFMLDSFYYLVDGFINSAGGRSQLILKVDLKGNLLKQTILEGPTNDIADSEGGGYYVTSDGHILLVGESRNLTENKMYAFLAKMNKDLETLWVRYYSDPLTDYYGCSVVEAPDRNYLVYFSENFLAQGFSKPRLLKTDTSGAVIWNKEIPDNVPWASNGNMAPAPDGNLLLCAEVVNYPANPSKPGGAIVAKVDYEANVLWHRELEYNGLTIPIQEVKVMPLLDGGHAVIWVKDTTTWIPYVTKPIYQTFSGWNDNSVKQWEIKWNDYSIRNIGRLNRTANGDLIGCGAYLSGFSSVPDKGWIFRATAEGEMLWSRYYSDPVRSQWSPLPIFDISETPDGRLAAIGSVLDSSVAGLTNINLVLLVLDENGCLTPGCSGEMQVITTSSGEPENPHWSATWLETAPNPVDEILQVETPSSNGNAQRELELYNAAGKLVSTVPAAFGETSVVPVGSLPNGFYLLVLREGNHCIARQKIIVQH